MSSTCIKLIYLSKILTIFLRIGVTRGGHGLMDRGISRHPGGLGSNPTSDFEEQLEDQTKKIHRGENTLRSTYERLKHGSVMKPLLRSLAYSF